MANGQMSDYQSSVEGGSLVNQSELALDEFGMWLKLQKQKNMQQMADYKVFVATKNRLEEESNKQIAQIRKRTDLDQAQQNELIAKLRINTENRILDMSEKLSKASYQAASVEGKLRITNARIEANTKQKQHADEMMASARLIEDVDARNAKVKEARKAQMEADNQSIADARQAAELAKQSAKNSSKFNLAERAEKRKTQKEALDNEAKLIKSAKAQNKESINNIKQKTKAYMDAGMSEEEARKKAESEEGATLSELEAQRKGLNEADLKNNLDQLGNQLAASVSKAAGKAIDAGLQSINEAMKISGQYTSAINTRLQGTDKTFAKINDTLADQLAMSPFVKQTKVLESLDEAVKAGIAYNVEQRAFLASVSDKIVTTFNAFDSNLMRLIRLQQADTTAARMGLEATLNEFLNKQFNDTSYLSDGFDNVSQALLDANAQMTRDMSISFEYNVQKWLGALSSLGFGTDTLTSIATGIGYLGTGNVKALTGNEQLNSLLAMAASRSGVSYSEMLINGIDDSQVNKLLQGMIVYLKEIAESENQVLKSAYGGVFNLTQSDFRALSNMTAEEITKIASSNVSYKSSMNKTQDQLLTMYQRMNVAEMIDNVFDNFMYTSAQEVANNPIMALTYKTVDMIEGLTGGIYLPFISAMGFGVDLNMSLEKLIKTGLFGISLMSNVPSMVTSIMSGGGVSLGAWGFDEYNVRGGGITSLDSGVRRGTSGAMTVGMSASSSDIKQGAIADTEADQEVMEKQSREKMSEDDFTLEKFYDNVHQHGSDAIQIVAKDNEVIAVFDSENQKKLDEMYKVLSSGTIKVTMDGFSGLVAAMTSPKETMIDFGQSARLFLNNKATEIKSSGDMIQTGSGDSTENLTIAQAVQDIYNNGVKINGDIELGYRTVNQLKEANY